MTQSDHRTPKPKSPLKQMTSYKPLVDMTNHGKHYVHDLGVMLKKKTKEIKLDLPEIKVKKAVNLVKHQFTTSPECISKHWKGDFSDVVNNYRGYSAQDIIALERYRMESRKRFSPWLIVSQLEKEGSFTRMSPDEKIFDKKKHLIS